MTLQDLQLHLYHLDIMLRIHDGDVFGLTKRVTIPTGISYFGMSVPDGVRFHLHSRAFNPGEGEYEIDVLSADSFDVGSADELVVANLHKGSSKQLQTQVWYGVTNPVNLVLKEEGYLNTGSGGSGNSSTAASLATESGIHKTFTGSSILRVNQIGGGDSVSSFSLVGWETTE